MLEVEEFFLRYDGDAGMLHRFICKLLFSSSFPSFRKQGHAQVTDTYLGGRGLLSVVADVVLSLSVSTFAAVT